MELELHVHTLKNSNLCNVLIASIVYCSDTVHELSVTR